MSALLDMPEVRQRLSRLSVEEYHRLGEFNGKGRRTELIRGLVIEKMSKSPLHSAVAKRLYKFRKSCRMFANLERVASLPRHPGSGS